MDDIISRQAAIEALYHHLPSKTMDDIRWMLHEVPSANPVRKKGKWIKGIDIPNRKPYLHLIDAKYCSECLNEAYWDTDYGQQMFDFCPNCGADMRGIDDV